MIKYLDLKTITDSHSEELHEAISRVVDSGWYLQGEANKQLESSYSSYIGTDIYRNYTFNISQQTDTSFS